MAETCTHETLRMTRYAPGVYICATDSHPECHEVFTASPAGTYATRHAAMPPAAHNCRAWHLTPEECYRSSQCARCGVRRDGHAAWSALPVSDPAPITVNDHLFQERS